MNPLTMTPAPGSPALTMGQNAEIGMKQAENSYAKALQTPRSDTVPLAEIDPSKIKNYDQIDAKAREFEAVFLAEMMKPMFESVDVDPLFGGGQAEDIFRGMQVQEYGKQIAETKGIGLADFVKRELIRIQQSSQEGVKNGA